MKVCVYTLGCKVNQYESGVIITKLIKKGYEVTTSLELADIYIINTCAVTNEAEKKSRQVVSRLKKINANAKIVICGCSSQNDSKKFIGDNRLIFGVSKKGDIVDCLEQSGDLVCSTPSYYEQSDFSELDRVRSYVKVQDGCDNFCSYCIVPYLRGRSRSREISSILSEINCQKNGVKEFVITGINISDYGKNIGTSLKQLMQNMQSSDYRVRLGSLEVSVITSEFLDTVSSLSNFCPHFHLSLQSGSDSMLKKMNRHYTTDEYMQKVELIRKYYNMAGITTDIIAGFPTETQEEHNQTLQFAKHVGFSDIHAFSYSKREGTAAAKLEQLNGDIINFRTDRLLAVKKQLKDEFLQKNMNSLHEVLLEEKQGDMFVGYTRNYIRAYIEDKGNFSENTFVNGILSNAFLDGGNFIVK